VTDAAPAANPSWSFDGKILTVRIPMTFRHQGGRKTIVAPDEAAPWAAPPPKPDDTADRAYDSDALRKTLDARGAWANVRAMPQRRDPPAFSAFLYRYRNAVERFFNKLKHFRAVATRYDQRDDNYIASIKLASIRIWLRHAQRAVT
jgi:hypothetical protein